MRSAYNPPSPSHPTLTCDILSLFGLHTSFNIFSLKLLCKISSEGSHYKQFNRISHPNKLSSKHRDLTLDYIFQKCEAVLGRRGTEAVPWPYQGPSSSQPTIAQSSSSGSSSSGSGGSGSGSGTSFMRHAKGSFQSRVEPEMVCETNIQQIPSEESSKKGHPDIPLMVALEKVKSKVNTISEDDEDICPICLEEYTSENPRIVTKCSHHYHLSCIYEWNERSETCPVCSKVTTLLMSNQMVRFWFQN
ncbi:hypothetical protein OSB04_un001614 [Centaurea solstitialis]|uniref:RING-type E3 ubiquitin transferase n=1 Tax=Centaurea solstitialis TaxID=347529 RepID=A0AA38SLI4_9ASTR|nr:hypothetical protein OSB04_un001614 [Centaurea solstitialis]